jgi:hypothetical protein
MIKDPTCHRESVGLFLKPRLTLSQALIQPASLSLTA